MDSLCDRFHVEFRMVIVFHLEQSGAWSVLKVMLVAIVLVFSLFLFVGVLVNGEIEGSTSPISSLPGNHKHGMLIERETHSVLAKHNPFYVSKRRVPSGPDPVHNRHVGNTRRPPGHA